jgi:hypothetical protein
MITHNFGYSISSDYWSLACEVIFIIVCCMFVVCTVWMYSIVDLCTLCKLNSVALSPQANYTDWATATCRRNLVSSSADRGVSRGQRGGTPTVVNLSFLDWNVHYVCYIKIKLLTCSILWGCITKYAFLEQNKLNWVEGKKESCTLLIPNVAPKIPFLQTSILKFCNTGFMSYWVNWSITCCSSA